MTLKGVLQAGCAATLLALPGCEELEPVGASWHENTKDTAWGISYLTVHLFNLLIANQTTGEQDMTIECSRGGTIRMTGRIDLNADTGIVTMDLTYAFDMARVAVVATNNMAVVFHPLVGSVRQVGETSSGTAEYHENYVSSSPVLGYNAAIWRAGRDTSNLGDHGSYVMETRSLEDQQGNAYRRVRGELDNCLFNWTYSMSGVTYTNSSSVRVIL